MTDERNKIHLETRRKVRNAFIAGVYKLREWTAIEEVQKKLEAGDIEGAVRAVPINSSLVEPMIEELRYAYRLQGENVIANLKPPPEIRNAHTFAFTFDIVGNPIAENYLMQESSHLIRDVVEPQKQLVRSVLTELMQDGRNPKEAAVDLVGRFNPKTRKREGGFIGLTRIQSEWVLNARRQLGVGTEDDLTDWEKEQLWKYLGRRLRDKRFDKSVMRALDEGRAIPKETQEAMARHYRARFLRYRAEVIGRTESLRSMNAARDNAIESVIDKGGTKEKYVSRKWRATHDGRTRETHAAASGQVRKLDEFFQVGGYDLKRPGDPAGPPHETIQCRCYLEVNVDWAQQLVDEHYS